jgi:iron complex outermembrane recepter protein
LMDVGPTLNPTPQNPSGLWPTSAPSGGPGAYFEGDHCNVQRYEAGLRGGCVASFDLTRASSHDRSAFKLDHLWNIEARASTSFAGAWNFLAGASYSESESYGDYTVISNLLDMVGSYGVPALGFPPLYPSVFDSALATDGGSRIESYSLFGEAYWQVSEAVKLTFGLRYNDDKSRLKQTSALFNSFDLNAAFGGVFGPDPVWIRVGLLDYALAGLGIIPADAVGEEAQNLAALYGATDAIGSATNPAELFAALQQVPPAPDFNEQYHLNGTPSRGHWNAVNGRLGIDWSLTDHNMLYAFYNRVSTPGGINDPQAPDNFDGEDINAFEVGSKNLLFNDALTLNLAAFYYDLSGIQIDRNLGYRSYVDTISAHIWGVELESVWRPATLPGLELDVGYGWLHTSISGTTALDVTARTQGDPTLVLLKNVNPDDTVGRNFVAPIDQVLPLVDAALFPAPTCAPLGPPGSGTGPCPPGALSDANGLTAPGTTYANGIPAYFRRAFLDANGVATSEGIEVNLDGNQLPNAPEQTLQLGIAYTWQFALGALTARWDYYWQAHSYAREFNRPGDEIDSWDQNNASLVFSDTSGRWSVMAWIRNIEDEENVTGHFIADDVSGVFRNYFLTEPRIYGASIRYTFGPK